MMSFSIEGDFFLELLYGIKIFPKLTTGQKILKRPGKKSREMKKNQLKYSEFFSPVKLHFCAVQKLIFGHLRNCKKWILVKKIGRKIDLFDFTSFLVWTLNFLAHCEVVGLPEGGHAHRVGTI